MLQQQNFGHKTDERQLLRAFRSLPSAQQATLMSFAEFLVARHTDAMQTNATTMDCNSIEPTPQSHPRPENETVLAAIKRLRRQYPMLDAAALLNDASLLMSAHLLQGRPAHEVITELETLFAQHFAHWQTHR